MLLPSILLCSSWVLLCHAATITGKTLRVMPLGDSITAGSCGSNGNGYRQYLNQLLDGNQVNFIGSTTDGTARDSQYEAHPGFYTDQVQRLAQNSLGSLPNVYLIHTGTNNLNTNSACAPAGSGGSSDACQNAVNALSSLLNTLYYTGALLVVAQITPTLSSSYNDRITIYNQLVANLVNSKNPSDGWRVQLANMQSQVSSSDIDASCGGTDSTNSNVVHPGDGGYQKMANVWYNAIVAGQSMIQQPPRQPYAYPLRSCANVSNTADGVNWCPNINVYPSREQINFYVGVSCSQYGSNQCNCTDSYNPSGFIVAQTGSCKEMSLTFTSAVRWTDLNGDGRQENVYITPSGALNTSLNTGNSFYPSIFGCASTASYFRELGIINVGPTTKRYQVRLADLDADNRAEYIVVAPDGSATGYYNTGSPHTLSSSIAVTFGSTAAQVAPSFGLSGVGVRFADFDGDGRADYIWVGSDGSLQVWLNKNNTAGTAAVTSWVSQGTVTPPLYGNPDRANVQIVDVNADGRADYLIISRADGTVGAFLNGKPPSGSTTPTWTFVVIASATNGTAAGANNFLAELHFGDPDGDGNYDYLVTSGGNSAVSGLKNRCPNQYIY